MSTRATVLGMLVIATAATVRAEVRWQHPAGLVTADTISEIKEKLAHQPWAQKTWQQRQQTLQRWMAISSDQLKRVFPRQRGNVYHNFSCPTDRLRLTFDPFNPDEFTCASCGHKYKPQTDAGIYPIGNRYHGSMYDGWICLFFLEASDVAADLALTGIIENKPELLKRAVEILMLHAESLEQIKTRPDRDPQMRVILTYHREGDGKVLYDLARAYELARSEMTSAERERFETSVLRRMLDDIMLEPIYRYEHNNLYQWHRTIVQTALALQREDLIDWSLGFGAFSPDKQPDHRSIRRLAATHFKKDGAFWEMCSGYHLYPMHYFCELAVITHTLPSMDSKRFPLAQYDLTEPSNEVGQTIKRALEWFLSMSMPDRTMPTIGDSMSSRAGMSDYYTTAEVGYRYYDVKGVGDYEALRDGTRSWGALLYGAPEIKQHQLPCRSSYLTSGWVSLRNEWKGNRIWVGLNSLIPGGGHQHADRLTLLTYSEGQLLALEKSTPYNELAVHDLATFSPMHNTVTVDKTTQKQGETLSGAEVPQVALFFDSPVLKFAELRGDQLYAQTKLYRRSVAILEDVVVDSFHVQGGSTHDWMLHHAGLHPEVSLDLKPGEFSPHEWLRNGMDAALTSTPSGTWSARWKVGDVTSRLTMLGAPGTQVYALQTYPVDNAVITPKNPPCQSMCVRREGGASRFVAVWDAWKDKPKVLSITPSESGQGLTLKTRDHTYYILFQAGEAGFSDGVTLSSDAAFAMARASDAAALVSGTRLALHTTRGDLSIHLDKLASLSAEYHDGILTQQLAGNIQYETYGGTDHPLSVPQVHPKFEGSLWKIRPSNEKKE